MLGLGKYSTTMVLLNWESNIEANVGKEFVWMLLIIGNAFKSCWANFM